MCVWCIYVGEEEAALARDGKRVWNDVDISSEPTERADTLQQHIQQLYELVVVVWTRKPWASLFALQAAEQTSHTWVGQVPNRERSKASTIGYLLG